MKKIMFVMLRTLGDVIVSTAIVKELKREYPDSRISFYTNSVYASVLRNNPDIYELVTSDEWNPDAVFLDIAKQKFDLEFIPYQVRGECNRWHQEETTRHQHLVDFYWKRMGFHNAIENRECYLFPGESEFIKAESLISFDVPRIAIHSTTGVKTKDWPRFDEMVEACRKAGYGCVQLGAVTDKPVLGAVDMRGKMDFCELAAFLSRCACFVGLDSGISYIADAMKTPTIVIQGSTNPITSGPVSPRVIHLFAKNTGFDDCQVVRCHANCRHDRNCIEEISVDQVLAEVEKIVSSWEAPIPARVD